MIKSLTAADAESCDAVIATLPYHFGDAGGRVACARAVREHNGLVAVDRGHVVGFLTVVRHDARSADITWMAVRADRRRRGRGRALVDEAAQLLQRDGVELICGHCGDRSASERREERALTTQTRHTIRGSIDREGGGETAPGWGVARARLTNSGGPRGTSGSRAR